MIQLNSVSDTALTFNQLKSYTPTEKHFHLASFVVILVQKSKYYKVKLHFATIIRQYGIPHKRVHLQCTFYQQPSGIILNWCHLLCTYNGDFKVRFKDILEFPPGADVGSEGE